MSDVPNTGVGSGGGGGASRGTDTIDRGAETREFNAGELAKIVATDEQALGKLNTADDKTLSPKAAAKVIVDRLTGLGTQSGASGIDEAAPIIAAAIPAALRTPTVLASIDLRPYLMALDGKQLGAMDGGGIGYGPTGVTFGGKAQAYVVHLEPLVRAETNRIQTALANGGDTQAAQQAGSFSSSVAGVNPIAGKQAPGADPLAPTTEGIDIDGDGIPDYTSLPSGDGTNFDIEGMHNLISIGSFDMEQLGLAEIKGQAAAAAAGQTDVPYYPVDLGRPTARVGTKMRMSAVDAMNYINTLRGDELVQLQQKLAAGGYYDRLPNGNAYLEGDPHDEATQQAWFALLKDAVVERKPVPEVLGTKMRSYRTELRDLRLRHMSKFDPGYAQLIAQDFAQSSLGRNFSADELDGLNTYLEGLRTRRQDFLQGAADNVTNGPINDEAHQEYDKLDVAEYEGAKTHTEQLMVNAQANRFALAKAMK